MFTVPEIATTTYLDLFGNRCRRLVAPAGDLTLWGDATIEDDGKLDPVLPGAREMPVADLPDDCLVYLMGSRYCETDRLSQAAWDMFGNTPPGWGRVQAICDFVNRHIRFDYQQARVDTHRVRGLQRARRGLPRLRASGADASAAASTSRPATSTAISATSACRSSTRWIFRPGSRCSSTAKWHTFDPRNNVPRIGRIVIARGRDAADIPLINSFGPHVLKSFRVWTYEVFSLPTDERAAAQL